MAKLRGAGANPETSQLIQRIASDAGRIALAKQWRKKHRDDLGVVALVARRAANAENPRDQLERDLSCNLHAIRLFLEGCQPRYFADVFWAGANQKDRSLLNFLVLLQQLGA